MTDNILARLAALKTTPTPDLKKQWRELFDSEAPPYNRRFLESRLAYRIQELAHGGLKPETIKRLERIRGPINANARTLAALAEALQRSGIEIEQHADGGVGPDDFAHARGHVGLAVEIAVGQHRAMKR